MGATFPYVSILNPSGAEVDTMTLRQVTDQQYLSEKIKYQFDSDYSQNVKTVVNGYRMKERVTCEAPTYNDTLSNWATKQNSTTTEWGVHQLIRLLDYFRQGYTLKYWPSKDWFDAGVEGEEVKIVDVSNTQKGSRTDGMTVEFVGINTRTYHFIDLDQF